MLLLYVMPLIRMRFFHIHTNIALYRPRYFSCKEKETIEGGSVYEGCYDTRLNVCTIYDHFDQRLLFITLSYRYL